MRRTVAFMECCMLDGKQSCVVWWAVQVDHTELMQAESGGADMCGSMHRVEEAV